MSAESRYLGGAGKACTRCLQVQATQHYCLIVDGRKETHELCERCAEQWSPPALRADPRNAQCFYCGDKAFSASLNQSWEREVRGGEFHYVCYPCMEEYQRVLIERLDDLPKNDSVEEQIRQMALLVEEVDSWVKSFAARSKN